MINKKVSVKKIFLSVFLFFNLISGVFSQEINFWSDYPNEQLAQMIVNQMTDTELYSQILMFGWSGTEPPQLLYDWVDRGLGSVKVFGWNTNDIHLVAKSVSSLQKDAQENRFKIPLFVATDQEGGWIRHVRGDTAITPGNMAIGAAGYPFDSYYSAFYICREIKALGINMNFAPTVDLFTNHNSKIIGPRSFGDDPDKAGILGSSFVAGSVAAGVIPTVKHFPGHGDTDLDSHGKLPVIDIDFNTFKTRELVPYYYLIEENCPALMSGHLSYPQLEPSGAPASMSKYLLIDLLRKQMGYEGLIITDDMQMVGATSYAGNMSNAFKMAIEAGNDIILSSSTARLNESLWTKNLDAMESELAFKERVKDAAYRVILAKLNYYKSGHSVAPLFPDPDSVDGFIPDREGEKFFLEQACRSITTEKLGEAVPLTGEKAGKVLLLGSLDCFIESGKSRFLNAGQFRMPDDLQNDSTQWYVDNIWKTASAYDTIIACVSCDNHAKVVNALKGKGKRVIVLSNMSPEYSKTLDWVDTLFYGYSWRCEYSIKAMMGAVCGDFIPQGRKPYN